MPNTILLPAAERPDDPSVAAAASILRGGGLLALPTETVYGIGAAADRPDAIDRLRELKGRDAEKPFTLAFAEREDALARAAHVTEAARRLADRFWPGPLTLVLPARDVPAVLRSPDGTVGLRVPGHETTRAVLRLLGGPVALPSANPAGAPPARDTSEVLAYFDGRIDGALDGGRAPLGQPSTVVRVGNKSIEVLREGILSDADIRRAAIRRVLFVCSGNTCRSPMAEALLKRALARRLGVPVARLADAGFEVQSAGVNAMPGDPLSDGARRALVARGIDGSAHRATRLTRDLLDAQDLVYAMTGTLLARLRSAASHPDRVRHVDPDGHDVLDPFGGTEAEYDASATQLERHVERILESL